MGKKIYTIIKNGVRVEVSPQEFEIAIKKAEIMVGDGKMVVLVTDDKKGKYQCKDCNMYIPETNECTNILGHIEPYGTCQLRHSGPNAKPEQINPFRLLKSEAGYDEREEGFGCGRCIRFQRPDTCKIIKDKVSAQKCCNYQFDGNITKSSKVDDKYQEEQAEAAAKSLKTTGMNHGALEEKVSKTKKSMLGHKHDIKKDDKRG